METAWDKLLWVASLSDEAEAAGGIGLLQPEQIISQLPSSPVAPLAERIGKKETALFCNRIL